MNEFIFRPCIEAAIPSGGLTDMSNAEAIEIGSALLTDRLAPTVLNQVRGESLRENREISYSNYRDICIDQYRGMFEMKHKKDELFVNLFPVSGIESAQKLCHRYWRRRRDGRYGSVCVLADWTSTLRCAGAQATDVSDAQLRAELETYIFNPCIESAVPPEGLADLDDETVTEVFGWDL